LATDPSVPVTGSVTAWITPETPDVSPESSVGWPSVAACACCAGSDRSRQMPPLAMANLAARRMMRRLFGFDIDSSRKIPGQLSGGSGQAHCSFTTVQ
jgi:hypothetical protein